MEKISKLTYNVIESESLTNTKQRVKQNTFPTLGGCVHDVQGTCYSLYFEILNNFSEGSSLAAQMVQRLPAMQEIQV